MFRIPHFFVGTTKEHSYQEILAEANRLIRTCETVPVRLTPDPSNPINAKAISFECQINGHWQRIGYAVNEVLDELHRDMRNNVIIGVNFKWIKFITDWYRSGPGWFTAINITKNGKWAKVIMDYESTR